MVAWTLSWGIRRLPSLPSLGIFPVLMPLVQKSQKYWPLLAAVLGYFFREDVLVLGGWLVGELEGFEVGDRWAAFSKHWGSLV